MCVRCTLRSSGKKSELFLTFFSCLVLQRKETLLKEYKQKNKSNKLIDRRFGEYDTKMAPEDKILQRFAMERQVSDLILHLTCMDTSGPCYT